MTIDCKWVCAYPSCKKENAYDVDVNQLPMETIEECKHCEQKTVLKFGVRVIVQVQSCTLDNQTTETTELSKAI